MHSATMVSLPAEVPRYGLMNLLHMTSLQESRFRIGYECTPLLGPLGDGERAAVRVCLLMRLELVKQVADACTTLFNS